VLGMHNQKLENVKEKMESVPYAVLHGKVVFVLA